MEMLRAVLFGVLPGVAGGLLLVGVLGRRWLGLAMAIGVFMAYALLKSVPPWPKDLYEGDNNGLQWFLWFVVGSGLIAVVGGRKLWPLSVALPVASVWFGAEVWFMLSRLRSGWSVGESLVQHVAACSLLVAVWTLLRRIVVRQPGAGLGIVWAACLVVDSVVLLLGRSALQGQLAAGAAAAFGAAVGTALWRRPFAIGATAVLPLVTTHVGLLLAGFHFSFLPAGSVLCAAAAPAGMLVAGAAAGPGGSRAIGASRFAFGLLTTGALAAAAIVLAVTTEQ